MSTNDAALAALLDEQRHADAARAAQQRGGATVSSRPAAPVAQTPRPQPQAVPRQQHQALGADARIAAGLLLCAFGCVGWVWGAWCTLRGWALGINAVLALLGVPDSTRVPEPAGLIGVALGLALLLQATYSVVEVRARPRRWWVGLYGYPLAALLLILWVVVIITDTGSTYWSLLNPRPTDARILQDIAHSGALSATTALVVTFYPEWFILSGIGLMFGRVGRNGYESRSTHPSGGHGRGAGGSGGRL